MIKRILAVILAIMMLVGLAACKKNDDTASSDTNTLPDKSSDIAAAVAEGKIPELEFKLGDEISVLRDRYNELYSDMQDAHTGEGHVHDDGDVLLDMSEGNLSVTYNIGTASYYYEKEKKQSGIAVVCSLQDAFGFKQGTSRSDIEGSLASLSLKSLNAGEDELYFVPIPDAIVLRYKKDGRQLDFYFSDNELVATVLRDLNNWTI